MADGTSSKRAVEIAREFLTAAGFAFNVVTRIDDHGQDWQIQAEAMSKKFQMRVRKADGAVEGFQEAPALR